MASFEQKTLEIRQSNAITSGRYDFTACQLDILFLTMSKLHLIEKNNESSPNLKYTLDLKEIEELTKRKWNHVQFKTATENMGSRMFEIQTDKKYKQIWMFQSVEYIYGESSINIELSNSIIPYLFELKNNFTSFELNAALNITSKYAKRIYQICSQWKNLRQSKAYTIEELKLMLQISYLDKETGKQVDSLKKFSDFKRVVLDVSIIQINEKTDLNIDYELVKKKGSKGIEKIVFLIDTVKPKQLPIDFRDVPIVAKNKDESHVLDWMKKYGIDKKEYLIKAIESEESMKKVRKILNHCEINKTKIGSIASYLIKSMEWI